MQLSGKSLTVWISLIVFHSAWMFLLGVLVGRGTIPLTFKPEAWKQELANRKAEALQEDRKRLETKETGQISKTDLGFYEALKEAAPSGRYSIKVPPAVQAKKAAPAPSPSAAPAPPEPAAPERERPKAADPADKGASADFSGRFTVQVAALRDQQGARQMVEKLRAKGFSAYQVSARHNQEQWYRVRVGAFAERADAEKVLQKINALKFKGFIVRTP